ncbi:MAG: hypothetical protein LC687_06635 [Actinobacteria bacterium]|nr:hypothetical protein [Actinomycetota bacterium]
MSTTAPIEHFHFFATTAWSYGKARSRAEAIEQCLDSSPIKLIESQDNMAVYQVPGPVTDIYDVANYIPMVDGVEHIQTDTIEVVKHGLSTH